MTTSARLLPVLAAGGALLLTAACSAPGDDAPASSAGATSPAATPSPTASDTAAARGRPLEAEVQVTEVTDTCVYVAVGDAERWALRGTVPAVAVGDRLTVTGAPDDTDYAECPDGRPFLVDRVVPVG